MAAAALMETMSLMMALLPPTAAAAAPDSAVSTLALLLLLALLLVYPVGALTWMQTASRRHGQILHDRVPSLPASTCPAGVLPHSCFCCSLMAALR